MTLTSVARARLPAIAGAVALLALMGVYIGVLYDLMVRYVAPTYTYLGYTFRDPDPLYNTLVVAGVLVLALLMPRRIRRPSHFVLWVHFLLATAPSMLVPQFTAQLDQTTAVRFGLAVGLAWLCVLVLTSDRASDVLARWTKRLGQTYGNRRSGSSPRTVFTARSWTVALVLVSLSIDLLIVALFGLAGELVGLTDVRDLRLGYREAIATAPPGTAYVVLFASNVLNPFLLMRTLLERRWWLVPVGGLGQLLIYATAGYKMVLLSIPAVVALYVWLRRRHDTRGALVLGGVAGVMAAAWALFVVWGSTILSFLFVMRSVVAPGNLSAAYVVIFQNRDPLYWSYSFMGGFIDYPYELTPNYLVGALFRGKPEVSANVNLFGDGYMAMRWGGIAIECLVLVIVLLVIDRASRGFSMAEVSSALLLPTFALCNSNVFTSLTTHGFFAATLLLLVAVPASQPPPAGEHRADRGDWLRRRLPWQRGALRPAEAPVAQVVKTPPSPQEEK